MSGLHPRNPTAARRWAPLALPASVGLVVGLALLAAGAARATVFDLEQVAAAARELAAHPFQQPQRVPDWLLDLDYDQWRDIRFRPEDALWRGAGLRFTVQFFHPGLFYDRSVRIHVVDGDGVHPVPFSPGQFDYGHNDFASRVPQDLGYAGLRLHYPIKTPSYQDEVIVFLGATYFRAVGRDEGFGLSARGLAVDTALPSGEEFPFFREFWLVRPAPGAKQAVVYALLDSPSLTGAYRFTVTPGVQTRVDVVLRLFRRKEVHRLGIGSLTSMYLRGENDAGTSVDYRPEVHDSDGLLVQMSTGEWIWRPVENPDSLSVTSFADTDPKGFGLMQRDRNFDHYQDLEARPDLRPSAWVAPTGDWGAGRVELVEIPSRRDTNDNVVAYWVPDTLPPLDQPVAYAYSLFWYGDDPDRPPGGRVTATRIDSGREDDSDRVLIDFEGGDLARLPEDTVLQGVVSVDGSSDGDAIRGQTLVRNPVTRGWRLVFEVKHPESDPVDLRAYLRRGDDALTETWSLPLRP